MRFYPLILCYHAISSSWPASLAVPEELLAQHVESLRSRGYQGFTLVEAERRRAAGTLPERSVVVTFDDAYASTRLAVPVLSAVGYPGTVFVVTRFTDSGELLRWPGIDQWCAGAHAHELRPLVWSELEELQAAGWEIGSHTVTHPRLPELDDDTLARELVDSRRTITARLGSCETIAYPYGLADARIAAAASSAGYAAAVTLTGAHTVDTPFLRPRIGLYPHDSGLRMRVKLSASFTGLRRTRLAAAAERLRDSVGGSRTSR
jgi:peptidoglycan/xylan/chitin deacetylase (PgdA/CDA1 family)